MQPTGADSIDPLNSHDQSSSVDGWLVNSEQQLVVQFQHETLCAQDEWVTLRTFHWREPDYPIPQSRRRMLRHKAIEAWEMMLKSGWRRCSPPVR